MTKVIDRLKSIENEFPVNQIVVDKQSFWPFFRIFVYAQLLEGLLMVFDHGYGSIFRKLKNAFFGFRYWFRRYDYVFISNEMERKKNDDNIIIDKLTEGLTQKLGYHNSLYIEQVNNRHLDRKNYGKKKVVSFDLILILAGFFKKLKKPGYKVLIEREDIFREILRKYNLRQNYREGIDTFLSKVFAFEAIFKQLKPKAIFITDYGNIAATYAAHKLGLKVVEFQHGVIGDSHPYYHPAIKLNEFFCPDYLLVFGLNDVKALSQGNYVSVSNIVSVGNYYLSILTDKEVNKNIVNLLDGYEKSVCIPTDYTTHSYLLGFIESLALKLPNYVFIISPRQAHLANGTKNLPENVKVITDYSFQEIVRHCDFNSSTNSTCCIEALALGARNILIDEDGLASQYFGRILKDEEITRFARSNEEYINHIKSMPFLSRIEVKGRNKGNYMDDYDKCISNFSTLLLKSASDSKE